MNVHERMKKTLHHEEPDRVPTLAQVFVHDFTKKVIESIPSSSRPKTFSVKKQMLEAAIHVGFDAIWYHNSLIEMKGKEKPNIPNEIKEKYGIDEKFVDEWGTYNINGFWYHDGVVKTPELLKEWISYIKIWTPANDSKFKRFKKIWEQYISKGLLTIPTGGGIAYPIWAMIGMNRFAYIVRKHLNLVKELARILGKITREFHNCLFEYGIDMVFICDDWAFKNKLIYNPKHWNEIVKPVYKELAKNAHAHDAHFLVHSDGDVRETLPFLVDARVDAIEPLESEAGIKLKPLKKHFGDKITLIGNIAASDILTFGTIEDTINATKQAIMDAASGGGYVLGAGSDILGTCKLENVKAMIQTTKKYGTYPIKI